MRLNLDLLKYWIPELRKIPEFRELAKVWDIEFKKLYGCTQKTLDDTFIDTASEDGIKRLEKIAGIYPDEGDSLEHRRTRLYSYWNDRKPYTEGELYNRLKALCGSSDFEIKPDYRNFLIQIITHVGGVGAMEEIEYMLDYFIPANLIVELKNILTGGSTAGIFCGVGTVSSMAYTITNDIEGTYPFINDLYIAHPMVLASETLVTNDISGSYKPEMTLNQGVVPVRAVELQITNDINSKAELIEEKTIGSVVSTSQIITTH